MGIGRDPETGLGTVWTSDNGLHWNRTGDVYIESGGATEPASAFPRPFGSVKAGGPGLVALERLGSVGAEIWVAEFSEAGFTWRNTATLEGPCCFVDIAASEDLIVVVSEQVNHQQGNPGVWTSTDAYTWERVPPETLPFRDASHGLAFVDAGGPGFVGLGFALSGTYLSIDGTEWFSPPDFAEAHPEAVHETHIAIGHSMGYTSLCHGDENGTWTCNSRVGGVTSAAGLDGRYVAVRESGSLGLSTDGQNWTWHRSTPETFISAAPIDVVKWQGRIIVLAGDFGGFTTWAWAPQPRE